MSAIRVTKLTVHNLGPIQDAVIDLAGKPLVIFYGEVMQGKTTLLNAVRWALGGQFPDDIVRHGCEDASVRLDFVEDGNAGWAARSWYIAKDGALKARAIEFARNGKLVSKPSDALRSLLNPFQLKQTYFSDMGETERRRFLAQLFGAEDAKESAELTELQSKAKELRAVLSGFGDIDLTEPPPLVDDSSIRAEIKAVQDKHQLDVSAISAENQKVQEHNSFVDRAQEKMDGWKATRHEVQRKITELQQEAESLEQKIYDGTTWLADPIHCKKETNALPVAPDTSSLQQKLSESAANRIRHEQYKANKDRAENRDAKKIELNSIEAREKELRAAKVARLAEVGNKCGIKGLLFKEDGGFDFEGTDAGMLSTSQVMRLSESMSALYPEGFNLSLLDRGESLGKSIFSLLVFLWWKMERLHNDLRTRHRNNPKP